MMKINTVFNLLLLFSISKYIYLYKIFTKLKANKLLFIKGMILFILNEKQ